MIITKIAEITYVDIQNVNKKHLKCTTTIIHVNVSIINGKYLRE